MLNSKRHLSLGLLVGLAGLGTALSAAADTPNSTIILNTLSQLAYEAPNGPAAKPVSKQTGAGVMDTTITFDNATGDIVSLWTNSVKPNGQSGVQGAIAISKLTATGLSPAAMTQLPSLDGERTFMRPIVAMGKNFIVAVFASEDHSDNNNGNPQAVAWVFDRAGKMLNITNTTRSDPTKPTNLIELSGQNDGQQYGPHSVCALGTEPDGSQSFIYGVQRNNQQAKVMKVSVKVDAAGATVTVPYLKTIVQNAQHNRVQLACPTDTQTAHAGKIVATTVEANTQPADIGVRAVLVDTATGGKIASTLIAASDPKNNLYAVQPTAQFISDSVVSIAYQTSAKTTKGNGNNGNGHANKSENLSHLATFSVPTTAGGTFAKLDIADRVAPYQRHAEAFGTLYGPENAKLPAIGYVGGSSTGTGKGLVQMMTIDAVTGKIGAVDPMKLYQVSNYSDVAALPALGKRNPNNQARGFLKGVYGVANPGYHNPAGIMPEVSSFSLSAVAGYKDMTTSNRESLYFSLIPATWDPSFNTTPGGVVPTVPAGPSPTAGAGTPVTNPGPGVSSTGSGGSTDGTGTGSMPGDNTPAPSTRAPGFGQAAASEGCACSAAPGSDRTSGLGGIALLGLGLAFLGFRRGNGTKKES